MGRKHKEKRPRIPSLNHLRTKENRRRKIETGVPNIRIRRDGKEILEKKGPHGKIDEDEYRKILGRIRQHGPI